MKATTTLTPLVIIHKDRQTANFALRGGALILVVETLAHQIEALCYLAVVETLSAFGAHVLFGNDP